MKENPYKNGTPVLLEDWYYHVEWTSSNGEKATTIWGVETYEMCVACIKQIQIKTLKERNQERCMTKREKTNTQSTP